MNGWHETYNDFPGPDVVCGHLQTIAVPPAPADPPDACRDCLTEGTTWVELRRCLVCGQTRCCESIPYAAAAFTGETRNPVPTAVIPRPIRPASA